MAVASPVPVHQVNQPVNHPIVSVKCWKQPIKNPLIAEFVGAEHSMRDEIGELHEAARLTVHIKRNLRVARHLADPRS